LRLGGIDPAAGPGDFFRACHLPALALLQRGDELPGFNQAFVRAGIEQS
jgi:hypothetical protein